METSPARPLAELPWEQQVFLRLVAAAEAAERILTDEHPMGSAANDLYAALVNARQLVKHREALQSERVPPEDLVALRANCHATFNGGWHGNPDGMRAFHHGMDTVINVLEEHREGHSGGVPFQSERVAPEGFSASFQPTLRESFAAFDRQAVARGEVGAAGREPPREPAAIAWCHCAVPLRTSDGKCDRCGYFVHVPVGAVPEPTPSPDLMRSGYWKDGQWIGPVPPGAPTEAMVFAAGKFLSEVKRDASVYDSFDVARDMLRAALAAAVSPKGGT